MAEEGLESMELAEDARAQGQLRLHMASVV